MKRKILLIILSLTAVFSCVFALTACDTDQHTHEYGEWEIVKSATCTENGERQRTCECGDVETETVYALGHDLVNRDGQDFSCTANGWKPYQECKREGCDYSTYEIIPMHHVYSNDYCVYCKRPRGEYEAQPDGTFVLNGMDLKDGTTDIVIPSEVNGVTVSAVGDFALSASKITSVVIPDTVTSLGDEVFKFCTNLKRVVIPDSVTSIGGGVFDECEELEYNIKDNGCYLGNDENPYLVFVKVSDTSITKFDIDPATKIIYYGCFRNCASLKEITISASIIDIGADVFSECSGLERVELPQTLEKICGYMFQGCSSLKNIDIPQSVTSIGDSAFERCESLKSVTLHEGILSIGESAFSGSEITSIIIPNSVTEIGGSAFAGCKSLESVILPESLTVIENDTFVECESLLWVYIPKNVTQIGNSEKVFNVFGQCENLTNIFYEGTAEDWANIQFAGRGGINSIPPEKVYYYSATKPAEEGNYWNWGGPDGAPAVIIF